MPSEITLEKSTKKLYGDVLEDAFRELMLGIAESFSYSQEKLSRIQRVSQKDKNLCRYSYFLRRQQNKNRYKKRMAYLKPKPGSRLPFRKKRANKGTK